MKEKLTDIIIIIIIYLISQHNIQHIPPKEPGQTL